jgi:hypothetical protein
MSKKHKMKDNRISTSNDAISLIDELLDYIKRNLFYSIEAREHLEEGFEALKNFIDKEC